MLAELLRENPERAHIHLTGIKGSGMTALAEVLHSLGARVSGSDVADRFYTDGLLARIGVEPRIGFAAAHVPAACDLLVYSAAYGEQNAERREAARRGIPTLRYTAALGELSAGRPSLGVAGVHGKTTTTAMVGVLVRAVGVPATVVVGSAVPDFGGSATLRLGSDYLIAETCEYRRHFLDFRPRVVLITSVEADHLDYFADASDVQDAFIAYARLVPAGGAVVACADDAGARDVAAVIAAERPDIDVRLYGQTARGPWRISDVVVADGAQHFTVAGRRWSLPMPGTHAVLNAVGALVALGALLAPGVPALPPELASEGASAALASFHGTRRRSEIVYRSDSVLVMDDYAHHPTAIRATLAGLRHFYPHHRITVAFMPHTYSRTAALFDAFAEAFSDADRVVINDVYASAREAHGSGPDGRALADAVATRHRDARFDHEFAAVCDAWFHDARAARPDRPELFLSMGAGVNDWIARELARRLEEERQ